MLLVCIAIHSTHTQLELMSAGSSRHPLVDTLTHITPSARNGLAEHTTTAHVLLLLLLPPPL